MFILSCSYFNKPQPRDATILNEVSRLRVNVESYLKNKQRGAVTIDFRKRGGYLACLSKMASRKTQTNEERSFHGSPLLPVYSSYKESKKMVNFPCENRSGYQSP